MNLTKYLLALSFSITLIGCSNTPNNINMTVTDGVCVQPSQYATTALAAKAIAAYPQIQSNPTTAAPYCASITLSNTNSGYNANTVQINSGGFTISYNVGNQSFNATLYDPVAAGLNIGGQTQQIGNIVIFDPKNCVTTQGINVQYLNTNGGKCTFYLQLMNEALPVGVYQTTMTYNYTNGNLNYSITNNINQRTYLYAGASNGIYFLANNIINASQNTANQASWSTGLPGTPLTSVSFITQSPLYGYIYFTTGNSVYLFNGISAVQIGQNLPAPAISIAFDNQLNPYVATTNGIYVYQESNGWIQMVDTFNNANSNLIGLNGIESIGNPNVLYAYNESQMYTCNNINLTTHTMNCSQQLSQTANPSTFFPNATAIDATSGSIYAGAYFAFNNQYSVGFLPTTQWTIPPYTVNPPILESSSPNYIGGLIWVPSNTSGGSNTLYFGLYNASSTIAQNESAVYSCSTATYSCNPLLSSSGNNIVGNVRAVANDGLGNIYVAGLQLNSNDFESYTNNALGGFLITNQTTINQGGKNNWVPIINGSITTAPINTLIVSSMLTSY